MPVTRNSVADDYGLREMWTAHDHKQLIDHFARVDTFSHGSFGSFPSTGHQVPVVVNGVQMLALIETGAGITVAARTILPLLRILNLQPCVVPVAVGMAGIPVHFVGCALVTIQIGSTVLSHLVHITACEGVPRSADAYNIILGNEILQKLPRWALNYSERKSFIGGEPIPIVSVSPDPTLSTSTVSVHLAPVTPSPSGAADKHSSVEIDLSKAEIRVSHHLYSFYSMSSKESSSRSDNRKQGAHGKTADYPRVSRNACRVSSSRTSSSSRVGTSHSSWTFSCHYEDRNDQATQSVQASARVSDSYHLRELRSGTNFSPSFDTALARARYGQSYVVVDALNVCRFVRDDAVPQQAPLYGCAPAAIPVGIQQHLVHPPQLELTPPGYSKEFSHLYPWGSFVFLRSRLPNLTEEEVTTQLPLHAHRHIPNSGYLGGRSVRLLFPRRFGGHPTASNPLPIMELTRLQDIIAFRQHAIQLLDQLLDYRFTDDTEDIRSLSSTPSGTHPSKALPPTRNGIRPVLYQVVARKYGQGVILKAKDFFIAGPDHRKLQCVPMIQDAVNALTQTRGFDRSRLSVKDSSGCSR
ncbi:unnamed protein product [Heligmosomoides polygyrus]|uniref:Reverse transcriptase domain-containing protein n=1 Tax=Heligmosomoides polygyrus TaxID=6339 RepID=A0A183FWS4_HELPZ|nr:unnamed protein product [Heligmosomoides polygyrus]